MIHIFIESGFRQLKHLNETLAAHPLGLHRMMSHMDVMCDHKASKVADEPAGKLH